MTKYGFLGLGIMGSGMAANLLKAGYEVTVWNRTPQRCEALVKMGARQAKTPAEVAASCEISFGMVSDPAAAIDLCCAENGVASGIGEGRGYIDMSTVDDQTVALVAAAIEQAGGRFLEAPVSGTKKPAADGTLIILAAGDRALYDEAQPAFEVMGKMAPYLGELGQGARMKLVVNMIMGGMLNIFCEGMALGQKGGLDGEQILEILAAGAMANPMFAGKGAMLLKEDYTTSFPLKHMQKDLRLAVELGDRLEQPLAGAAAANEVFKQARKAGSSDEDIAALYKVVK